MLYSGTTNSKILDFTLVYRLNDLTQRSSVAANKNRADHLALRLRILNQHLYLVEIRVIV